MDEVYTPIVVEQARDVLMVWFDVSASEAAHLLTAWAHQTHASVAELATALVFDILRGTPSGCQGHVLRHVEDNLRQLPHRLTSADDGSLGSNHVAI
ncbi:ANTAR domain-containing protein [Kribbella capetownensis]|nr:ANTAR domain-containing protein [Kribbella capetownensis]